MASTAKKLAAQIEAAEAELKERQNQLKELRNKHTVQAGKEQAHRWKNRGEILENFIEGAETLTDEQICDFLTKTITTKFALNTLAELKAHNAVSQGENREATEEAPGD